jgi:hypothetical protein
MCGSFEEYVESHLTLNNAQVAFGDTMKNAIFINSTVLRMKTEERNMHIGFSLWIKAGTPVLSALDGSVHSCISTPVLELRSHYRFTHQIENQTFYTLYGHLSLDSLEVCRLELFSNKENKLRFG